jgi:predicted aldo/keto reductase-like oxidoreductase
MVGAALKNRRKEVLISTKSGAEDKTSLQEELETSLEELGTDYIDIWYMHGKNSPDQITDDHIEVIENAKKVGKIRFAGVSTHGGQKILVPALAKNPHIDVILTAYNFTMDDEMTHVIEQARHAGKAVVGMKVMAGGFRRREAGDPLFEKFKRSGTLLAALKWVLQNQQVDTTIPSITDMEQLDENLKAMSESFSPADEELLARQMDYIRPLYCRMCGSCEGLCPKGVPVPDILRHLAYLEGYGQFELARQGFLELPKNARNIRCSDCSVCSVKCPNGVKVAQRLSRAQELFA